MVLILQGQKKRLLKEIIKYYVETTGKDYDSFILESATINTKNTSDLTYSEWLTKKCFEILNKHGITLEDCIENKDVINAAVNEESSRNQGEFFTPEVWAKDGREYLKDMLGDLWGKAYIWEGSCGSGNLIKSIDYPMDKIFMSSLLPEDIKIVNTILPEVEAFQLDFLNKIDWDEHNMHFSESLPPRLRQVLENDEPIVFYMNPPYKVMEANSSDVGAYMSSLGMAKCALDIFHQFMYRLIMLKRTYKLTNMYLGIFGPVTMFHSTMLEPLFNEFKDEFIFNGGMCFDAGDFSNTSESVGWIIGYTTWRTKLAGETEKSIVLDAKVSDGETITVKGQRLLKTLDETLHSWVRPNNVVRYNLLPSLTNFQNFTGNLDKSVDSALGYMMSASRVIDASRRAAITSLPNIGNIAITEENFWRCVASFSARRTYTNKKNPFNNSQYFNKPDTTIEGYNQWLADALILFLFDYDSQSSSYRNLEIDGAVWNISNRLFPIDANIIKSVVTDPVILKDLEDNPPENEFVVKVLSEMTPHLGEEAKELYEFGLKLLLDSLEAEKRKNSEYQKWTQAWDAGIIQLRHIEGFISEDDAKEYEYKIAKLKDRLHDGVYKYGFMMDAAFPLSAEDLVDIEEE